jgi:hypothetical protein
MPPAGEPYSTRYCRLCWLYAYDPEYRQGWDAQEPLAAAAPLANETAGRGPGAELKKLLASLGIDSMPGCACNAKAAEMDAWGVRGCLERRDEIAAWMRENGKKRRWGCKFRAALRALASGLAFRLDLSDPYGSLVDMAIQRAQEAGTASP